MIPQVQTIRGPVPGNALGITLPHEHLFNDLSNVLDAPSYGFSAGLIDTEVSASVAWSLRHDPYCCADNIADKPVESVLGEIETFQAVGGQTVVDATSSPGIGRNPQRLHEAAQRTGLNIIMGCGTYLEKFDGTTITARSIDQQASTITAELRHGVAESGLRPGIIGEIGVSPMFTDAERAALRAAALAQLEHPSVALMIHLPGWQRRGHEVLDIVLDEIGVHPAKVVLSHMDPSGADTAYQHSVADRGVWLEFDMIGMDVTFPHEGTAPPVEATASAVTGLIQRGFGTNLLLSHDLFLKQMWVQHGGNGLAYVPTVFAELLAARGVPRDVLTTLLVDNPQEMLTREPTRRAGSHLA